MDDAVENIELLAMSKKSKKTKIQIPSEAEDIRIVTAAKGYPDALPLTEKQLKAMVPMKSLRGLHKRMRS